MNPSTLFALGAAGGLAGAIATYLLIRRYKGHVRIDLPRPHRYQPGEDICGQIWIGLRSPSSATRISLTLTCTETVRTHSLNGSSRTTDTVLHRSQMVLAEHVPLRAGTNSPFAFRLALPAEVRRPVVAIPAELEAAFGSFGKALGTLVENIQRTTRSDMRWTLMVAIDMPGVDLSASTTIDVNLEHA